MFIHYFTGINTAAQTITLEERDFRMKDVRPGSNQSQAVEATCVVVWAEWGSYSGKSALELLRETERNKRFITGLDIGINAEISQMDVYFVWGVLEIWLTCVCRIWPSVLSFFRGFLSLHNRYRFVARATEERTRVFRLTKYTLHYFV